MRVALRERRALPKQRDKWDRSRFAWKCAPRGKVGRKLQERVLNKIVFNIVYSRNKMLFFQINFFVNNFLTNNEQRLKLVAGLLRVMTLTIYVKVIGRLLPFSTVLPIFVIFYKL